MKKVRIAVKILLCISLIVAVGLLLNYTKNLNPVQDGFSVVDMIPRLFHGDDFWTWEQLTNGVYAAWSVFAGVFCIDKILECIALKKSKQ